MKKGGGMGWLDCSSTYTNKVRVGKEEGSLFKAKTTRSTRGRKSRAVFFNNT